MLNPISFLWRQFNGPQITAICQALFGYFKNLCDENLDYFNDMSITTANTEHLSLLGILQGIARPLVPVPDAETFWFTLDYEYIPGPGIEPETQYEGHKIPATNFPSEHGFSNGYYGQGGVFTEEPGQTTGYQYIPDYIFREILRGNSLSEGELGGLLVLDDMLNALYERENPGFRPPYRFKWNQLAPGAYDTPGDITIDLGMSGDWAHPYEVFAQMKLLGSTIYYPIPRLIATIQEGDPARDPIGFVHILVDGVGDVYGLDNMWEGTGTPADYVAGEDPLFAVQPIDSVMLQTMWSQDNQWLDEESPNYFQPLTEETLEAMW